MDMDRKWIWIGYAYGSILSKIIAVRLAKPGSGGKRMQNLDQVKRPQPWWGVHNVAASSNLTTDHEGGDCFNHQFNFHWVWSYEMLFMVRYIWHIWYIGSLPGQIKWHVLQLHVFIVAVPSLWRGWLIFLSKYNWFLFAFIFSLESIIMLICKINGLDGFPLLYLDWIANIQIEEGRFQKIFCLTFIKP